MRADGQSLFIAQQVLILVGSTILLDPIIDLVEFHASDRVAQANSQHHSIVGKIVRVLRLAVAVTIILSIIAASKIGSVKTQDDVDSLHDYRVAAAALAVFVNALTLLLVVGLHLLYDLKRTGSLWLVVASIVSLLQNAFRLYVTTHSDSEGPLDESTKIQYYILSALPEAVVTFMFFAINVRSREGWL